MQKIFTTVVVFVLVGLISHSLFTITQRGDAQKAQVTQSSEYGVTNLSVIAGQSGGSGGSGGSGSAKCKCPYRYIIVSGQGSTSEHPMFKELSGVAPGATQIYLNNGKKDDPEAVKAKLHAEVDKNTADGYKTLIIAHSMGSVISINEFVGKNSCVELYAIDPPVNMAWYICNKLYASGGSARCKAILAAKECLDKQQNVRNDKGRKPVVNNCQVNWCTEGKCFPRTAHDPFSYPTASGSKEKIAEIKKEIESKKRTCTSQN